MTRNSFPQRFLKADSSNNLPMLRIMEVPGSEMPVILSSSTIVNGHLTFLTDVHIDCEAFGKIESRKKIIIGKNGYLKGEIYSRDLVVFGSIEGEIVVLETLTIHAGSNIRGIISAGRMELKDGAVLNAKVNMHDHPEKNIQKENYVAMETLDILSCQKRKWIELPTVSPSNSFAKIFEELNKQL